MSNLFFTLLICFFLFVVESILFSYHSRDIILRSKTSLFYNYIRRCLQKTKASHKDFAVFFMSILSLFTTLFLFAGITKGLFFFVILKLINISMFMNEKNQKFIYDFLSFFLINTFGLAVLFIMKESFLGFEFILFFIINFIFMQKQGIRLIKSISKKIDAKILRIILLDLYFWSTYLIFSKENFLELSLILSSIYLLSSAFNYIYLIASPSLRRVQINLNIVPVVLIISIIGVTVKAISWKF